MADISQNAQTTASVPEQRDWLRLGLGLGLLLGLTVIVFWLDGVLLAAFRAQGIKGNLLEYPLVAIILGLLVNGLLHLTGHYEFIRPVLKTESYLRVGVILLGARVAFGTLLSTGLGGILQAVIMVTMVFGFTWWLAGRMQLPASLKAVMSSAVSICGVSAAIAAAGSVHAKKEEISYVTALVVVTALPLMILMPLVATALNLPPEVAGAWFGGNIDTTAAVVGAGTLYGEKAQEVAAIVKTAQNVLMGFVAFGLATYYVVQVERKPDERPSLGLIWQRFPKFVLGFILMSILTSLGVFSKEILANINTVNQWIFGLAFVCIGLDFSVSALKEAGWKPISVYLSATVFNTLLALLVASLIFGVLLAA